MNVKMNNIKEPHIKKDRTEERQKAKRAIRACCLHVGRGSGGGEGLLHCFKANRPPPPPPLVNQKPPMEQ